MMDPNDVTRFEPFTIHTTPYKTAHDQPITTDVLYPTALKSNPKALATPRPVIIRFHGGGLITGSSLFPGFFNQWLLDLAQKHDAIIVSADYRLLPEASPADILSDIADLWTWVHSSLPVYLGAETRGAVKGDLSRIIVSGESVGGLIALLLGLEQPDGIKAILAQYPMIDLKAPHFTQEFDKKPFGRPISQFPTSLVDDLLSGARKHEKDTGTRLVVSSDRYLSRLEAMLSALVHGRFKELIEDKDGGEELYVFDRLQRGQKLPRGGVFVWHGSEDSLIPLQGSYELERIVKETNPEVKFRLDVLPGEHGFDSDKGLQEDWIKEAIGEVEQTWLL